MGDPMTGDQLRDSDEELESLERLTERYCVVLQTLASSPGLSASVERS